MQIRGLSRTLLGVYLIALGLVQLLPVLLSPVMPLLGLLGVAAGTLILLERRQR